MSKASSAVMARRAAAEVATDTAQSAIYRTLDYYPTPLWAARAGAEIVMGMDPGPWKVWEPACGAGHMASALAEYFVVVASDVYPHGYGAVVDFLDDDVGVSEVDWVISNPPFKTAAQFVTLGLKRARRGVALLLRLSFLEGQARHELLYGDAPLSAVAPFSERVPMTLGRWDPEASSATAYAWFIWRHGHAGPAMLLPIAPGARDRLSRPEDAARFGWSPPSPLFDAVPA